ncbi:hypothetical protein TL16_g12569, partial [Triparma laevis f. inornata]
HETAISACYDAKAQVTGDSRLAPPTSITLPSRIRGKVRDQYHLPSSILLLTTDRQSGFDRSLASVPFKGSVLNQISNFWFKKTEHIIPNHILSLPHSNITVAKKCTPFAVEMVVRSYMTGSTSTSIWKNYSSGIRDYCGHNLREGYVKNVKLDETIFTPTTKDEHDRPISCEEIVSEGLMTKEDLDFCSQKVLEVFKFGQEWAADRGLILVDTKFELGKDENGDIILIDEVLTPDSSRYWIKSSYEERIAAGKEPENIDKEFLRLWFSKNCDPYADEVLPDAPKDMVCELSRRYVGLYEMITGEAFIVPEGGEEGVKKAVEE